AREAGLPDSDGYAHDLAGADAPLSSRGRQPEGSLSEPSRDSKGVPRCARDDSLGGFFHREAASGESIFRARARYARRTGIDPTSRTRIRMSARQKAWSTTSFKFSLASRVRPASFGVLSFAEGRKALRSLARPPMSFAVLA